MLFVLMKQNHSSKIGWERKTDKVGTKRQLNLKICWTEEEDDKYFVVVVVYYPWKTHIVLFVSFRTTLYISDFDGMKLHVSI